VNRRVDVRPGVHAELEPADVGEVAVVERQHPLEADVGVARVDDHPRIDRHADVDDLHATRLCHRLR
jgi:hypothetical protein